MRRHDVPAAGTMHSRHSSILAFAAAALSMLLIPGASAWSNGGYSADVENPDYGTHDWIADMALGLQEVDVSFLRTTYHAEFLLGTEAPDNPDFIGDSVNHHVYYWSSGELQDDVCADRASAMYELALGRLEAGDFSVAAYYTGAMAHYISDVGVFGHTMGTYTDWGAEEHHSDYEAEFEDMLVDLDEPTGMALGNESAYDATLALARDITFGSGGIRSNVWMDENYDWSDLDFTESAMESLHAAVSAVASAVNRLMIESSQEPPPDPDDGDDEPVTPDSTPPTPPRSPEAYLDDRKVTVTWYAPSSDGGEPIIEYILYRSEGTGAAAEMAVVPKTAQSWTDDSVQQGKTYNYSVRARNSVGLSEPSATITVVVPEGSGTSLLLGAIVAAVAAAVASGGAVAWRRSRRRD